MASEEKGKEHGELSKPSKRPRKVAFSADVALDPNDCITIRLVSSGEEMQGAGSGSVPEFSPDFAERFFGEEGKFFGYKDLKIVVWLHALSFYAHVDISHTETIQDQKRAKQQVTNLREVFKDIFGEGLIEERSKFLELLTSYNNFSNVLHQYGKRIKIGDDPLDGSKEILLVEDLAANEVKDWHSRLTPLALMFIEAATPIERKDPNWEVYLGLEKVRPDLPWRVVGFCRVYRFFKYPDSTRLRVSQILVLPPYRGKKNGFHLLDAVYKTAVERDSFEVTMEEPSDELQVLRECMDVVRLLSFEPVRSDLQATLLKLRRSSTSGASFQDCMPSSALVEMVREKFKICRLHLQCCWHVLVYLHVMHASNKNTMAGFKNLISWSLKLEVFGSPKSTNVGKNKMLFDVENEYDSSRTFVMFKVKPSPSGVVKEGEMQYEHLTEAVGIDQAANTEDSYQELLKEREEEILQIAKKVVPYLRRTGTSLIEMKDF